LNPFRQGLFARLSLQDAVRRLPKLRLVVDAVRLQPPLPREVEALRRP
jgi:hypothetical protein